MTLKTGFSLGEWTVLPLEGRLLRGEDVVHIPPKTMDVLCCLAAAPGQVVERDAIIEHVWGRRAVSDEPLTRVVGELRRQLGDHHDCPRYIQTIPKRGYQLIAPVEPGVRKTRAPAPAQTPRRSSFFAELRRRRVFRVAVAYGIGAWAIIEVADATFEPLNIPAWGVTFVIMLALLGFPIAVILAWAFQITADGLRRDAPDTHSRWLYALAIVWVVGARGADAEIDID